MLVSIIIPLYNKVDYIKDCLESCINQSYKNIEIVVVDDCSTDGSYELAKEILEHGNKPYMIVQNDNNIGVSESRNEGIKISSGNKLLFADADDILHKDLVLSLVNCLTSNNDISAYVSDPLKFSCHDVPKWKSNPKVHIFEQQTFGTNCWGILIDKILFTKYNLHFENIRNGEDCIFVSDLFGLTKIYNITEKLYGYRLQVPNSIVYGMYSNQTKEVIRQKDCIQVMKTKVSMDDTKRQKTSRILFFKQRKIMLLEAMYLVKDKNNYNELKYCLPLKYMFQSDLSIWIKLKEIMTAYILCFRQPFNLLYTLKRRLKK